MTYLRESSESFEAFQARAARLSAKELERGHLIDIWIWKRLEESFEQAKLRDERWQETVKRRGIRQEDIDNVRRRLALNALSYDELLFMSGGSVDSLFHYFCQMAQMTKPNVIIQKTVEAIAQNWRQMREAM